ncbi:MAG: PTS sugar transporter subunit IIA [Spirochaetaceae bacterium]|nr:PTS sugar transporter subunit IIA [Spirochaetaceae bacterium]
MGILANLTEKNIKVPLLAATKEEALHELVTALSKNVAISNVAEAYEAVLNREKQGSTGLGEEIAIPHAKTAAVETIEIMVGISPKGINFNSLDGRPVKMFFLILANPNYASAHIEALSEIAKATRNKVFCRDLISAANVQEVLTVFNNAK